MKNKGFSLVELAITIVIVGLLIAMGVKIMTPLVERTKRSASKDAVDAAVAAVIGFAEANNRLPTDVEFPGVVRSSKDVWGKDLVYLHDTALDADDSVCARSSTAISLDTCSTSDCLPPAATTNNIAFLVLSGGANQNVQTDTASLPLPVTVKVYSMGLAGIDDDATDIDRAEPYDDIVERVVLSELRTNVGCFGSPLKILTVEVPSGYVLTTYSSNIFADEGVRFDGDGDINTPPDEYQWCVTSALPAGLHYECDGVLAVSPSCTVAGTAPAEYWNQCISLEIADTPTVSGAYSLPVYARDDAGNIATRTFGLSISSISGLNVCATYRVWNNVGSAKDFYVNAACIENVADDAEITTASTNELGNTGSLDLYDDSGSCVSLEGGLSYIQAIFADNNADCCINYDQTDTACH